MVLGGQTSGFSAAPYVSPNANFPTSNGPKSADTKPAINRVSPADVSKVATQKPGAKADQFVDIADKATQNHEDAKRVHDDLKKDKALQADTFKSRIEVGKSRSEVLLQQVAVKQLNDKEFKKQQAENFAKNLSESQLKGKANQGAVQQEPLSADKDQNLASNVVQSQIETLDPDAKARKKLDDKLQKIYNSGSEKGKHFVSFVSREMTKGPLPKSILELVDGFLETLKPQGSQTPSQMIASGNEPISTLKSMVSATDLEELGQIQNSLANSVVASAGEKTDLLAIRNLLKVEVRQAPPPALVSNFNDRDNLKTAADFVISINRGVANTPWDAIAA